MNKHTLQKRMIQTGAGLLSTSVALGALGAHAIKPLITAEHLALYETATKYMMIQGLGILLLAALITRLHEKITRTVFYMLVTGITIFSGTLILLATRSLWIGDSIKWLGAITPVGGILMITAWAIIAIKGFSNEQDYNKN